MIAPGTYLAQATGASVYESAGGALMLAFAFEVPNEGGEPERLTAHQCLVQKDGTVSTITVGMCKTCWGWDGTDPFWLTDPANLAGKDVEIVCEEDSWTNNKGEVKTGVKVRYINPPGGGNRLPEPADRKAVLAKYGAKFRAISGGTQVKKPATTAPPKAMAPAPKPKAPAPADPPAAPKPISSMQEAWNTLNEAMAGQPEDTVHAAWYEKLKAAVPGKSNQQDFTPEDWGAVKAACEDNVSY
jgi:hypothetical protein